LWIHTGQTVDDYAKQRFRAGDLFTGGIVSTVFLSGIRPFSASSWEAWRARHLDDSPFHEELAKYGWILKDPRRLERPKRIKGDIGLFRLPDALLATLDLAAHLRPEESV
jgi:hypothetical protein